MSELVITVIVVIVVSGLCSLCEAVLYAVPISHVESMAASGRPTGRILRRLRQDVDRPIAAVLSLNTIANTAGAAVAGAIADHVFGTEKVVYFSVLFTLAILIFSEVIPKTAGVTYSRSLAGLVARPLLALVWIFAPLIWLTRRITRLISRGRPEQSISDEELIVMARLGLKTGGIDEDEARVIQNILSLENRTVREIMTPRTVMFSLSASMTVAQVREEVGFLIHSRIPVYDENVEDIVGVVHRREMLSAMAEGKPDTRLDSLMRPVDFVVEAFALNRLLRMFVDRKRHLFVVIDEFGGLSGIVTLEDVLEEILGREIVDEFDEVADMRQLAHKRREETLKDKLIE